MKGKGSPGFAVVGLLCLLIYSRSFGDQVVTNVLDGGPGSLRQAILNAGAGDTIRFSGQPVQQIVLTNGELTINGNFTIIGPTAGAATNQGLLISGGNQGRVFHFIGGTNALFNLTISGGTSTQSGGGILNEASSTLVLGQCNIVTNTAANAGGGIANYGRLSLNGCTVAGNTAGTIGGGIYSSNAWLSVTNCSLNANHSTLGGGIYNDGGVETLQNCTIAANGVAGTGGGISSGNNPPALATNYIGSTIVAQNQATNNPDLEGSFFSLGYNLVGILTAGANFGPTNQDLYGTYASPLAPLLGPLQNNGGPTLTMALLPGSPAIDQGYAVGLLTDQRGWPRKYDYRLLPNPPGGDGSDIGAFELSPPSPMLTVALAAGSVLLSWPTNEPEFRLQSATVPPPASQWLDWSGPLVISADHYVATEDHPSGAKYFRLRAPFPGQLGLPANVATLAAAQLTTNTEILQGSVIPGGSNIVCWFQYSTDTSYTLSTAPVSVVASSNRNVVASTISGLNPLTLYHFRFVVGSGGGTSYGNDLTFATTLFPTVNTLAPTLVSSNSVVLNGTVNPGGSPAAGWFVLFTLNPPSSSAVSTQSLGYSTKPVTLSQMVTGLTAGVTYYFYAVGNNGNGSSYGNSATFTIPVDPPPATNVTIAENALPGTTDWKLTNPVTVGTGTNYGDREWPTLRTHAIEGYASATSVNKGEWLTFYVSTTSPTFSLEIFRMGYYGGLGARRMTNGSWFNLPGADQPTPPIQSDGLLECNWQPTFLTGATNGSFQVPLDWVSGVYVAKLTASSGKQSYIIFVVRDDGRTSPYLVQSSVTTYQAYNEWGGKSTYFGVASNSSTVVALCATRVSFDRPYMTSSHPGAAYGNGAGEFFTWGKVPGSATQEPATWEYNMVRWLESQGYDVTYCTDIDVNRDPNLLLPHKAFLSVGHDEYWSGTARTNVERARDLGVDLAFFSGNTVWNMVRLDPDSQGNALRTMVYHRSEIDPYNTPPTWGNFTQIKWYAESLVGGTWQGGGDANMQVTAQCPAWLTDGTALVSGANLGNYLAGYEVNGFITNSGYNSWNVVPPDTAVVFAGSRAGLSARSISYTAQASGATVFSAATIQWSWGLDAFTVDGVPPISPVRTNRLSADVQQVTSNVLRRFVDSTRMAADLADGQYAIQSANAYPQGLQGNSPGVSNAPVGISGYPGGTATNSQAVWLITHYTGDRLPCAGPYKTAADQWYTIRNKQTGQTLIVGNGGSPGGPVMLVGDATGYWGAAPDNLQMMWRIWHYTGNNEGWYLFQNVASGQLLIAPNNNPAGTTVVVYGDNGGWGETEQNLQKMWVLTPQ